MSEPLRRARPSARGTRNDNRSGPFAVVSSILTLFLGLAMLLSVTVHLPYLVPDTFAVGSGHSGHNSHDTADAGAAQEALPELSDEAICHLLPFNQPSRIDSFAASRCVTWPGITMRAPVEFRLAGVDAVILPRAIAPERQALLQRFNL